MHSQVSHLLLLVPSLLETGPVCYRSVEQCHYTYVTKFKAAQEEICDENYEKVCQISYSSKAVNDTIKKCYRPVQKVSTALFTL